MGRGATGPWVLVVLTVAALAAAACAAPAPRGGSVRGVGLRRAVPRPCAAAGGWPGCWRAGPRALLVRLRGGAVDQDILLEARRDEGEDDEEEDDEEDEVEEAEAEAGEQGGASACQGGSKARKLDLRSATVEELEAELRLRQEEEASGDEEERVERARRKLEGLYEASEVQIDDEERAEEELQQQWLEEYEAERARGAAGEEGADLELAEIDEGAVATLRGVMLESRKALEHDYALSSLDALDKAFRPADPEAGVGIGGMTPGELFGHRCNGTDMDEALAVTMLKLDKKVRDLRQQAEERQRHGHEARVAREVAEAAALEASLAEEGACAAEQEQREREEEAAEQRALDEEQQWRDAVYVLTGKSGSNVTRADLPMEVLQQHPDMPRPDMGRLLEEMGEFGDMIGVPTPSLESFDERYMEGVQERIDASRKAREKAKEERRRRREEEGLGEGEEGVEGGEGDGEGDGRRSSQYIVYKGDDGDKPTVFYDSMLPEEVDEAQELKGAECVNMSLQEELYDAAEDGDYARVLELIKRGARPDPGNHSIYGRSALHWAAFGGHAKTVEVLLDHGSDIDLEDPETGCTPLHCACDNQHVDAARELLRRGANPNVHDYTGRTALHRACVSGGADIVEVLIEGGADLEIKDGMDATPLHVACYWGNTHAALRLIHAGANLDARNGFEYTPQEAAVSANQTEVARLVQEHGQCRNKDCWEASSLAKEFASREESFLKEMERIDHQDHSEFIKEITGEDEQSRKVKEFREMWSRKHNEMQWSLD